jgi:hypothetical protein
MSKVRIRKILLAGDFRFEFHAPAWLRAFSELGLTVIPFSIDKFWEYCRFTYFENRVLFGPVLREINRALLKASYATKPDVILLYSGNLIRPQTVEILASRFWMAGFHNDDPFGRYGKKIYFRWFRASIPHYSSHHVYREKNIWDYHKLGVQNVSLLMSYYCPWLSYPVQGSGSEPFPVVFVGNAEPKLRSGYVRELVKKGIDIRVFGPTNYWKRFLDRRTFSRLHPIRWISSHEYASVIGQAGICLAFFDPGNNDQYTRRVFEIPACHGFLLAQRTPVMQGLYEEGKEAEFFDSTDELLDKIRYYLSHENARRRVAKAGHRRCLKSGYDIYSRMRQWVRDTEGWMNEA